MATNSKSRLTEGPHGSAPSKVARSDVAVSVRSGIDDVSVGSKDPGVNLDALLAEHSAAARRLADARHREEGTAVAQLEREMTQTRLRIERAARVVSAADFVTGPARPPMATPAGGPGRESTSRAAAKTTAPTSVDQRRPARTATASRVLLARTGALDELPAALVLALQGGAPLTARELIAPAERALGRKVARGEINRMLYSHSSLFVSDRASNPRWRIAE
ncbi:hypothetical protein Cma02nite_24140 [Cellulomonas marina]|nr:hypothetical protein Cma02nite_24140 [Cellulomonas marina]